MKIGFIGLGRMGKPITTNLMKAGHHLYINDINHSVVQELALMGAEICSNPKEVANKSHVIILSLLKPEIIEKVVMNKDGGILEGNITNKTVIDLSTSTPITSKKMAKMLSKKSANWLEAPVSGGETGAKNRTLTIMVSGDESNYQNYLPIFNVIAKKVQYVGEIGTALSIKLINQLLFFINLAGIGEAFNLALKLGIDFDKLYSIISKSSGGSYALETRYKKHIKREKYAPGAPIDLLIKDLEIILSLAKEYDLPLFMGDLARNIYQMCNAMGYGNQDVSSLYSIYQKLIARNKY